MRRYAPDYVVSAGGIINVTPEYRREPQDRAEGLERRDMAHGFSDDAQVGCGQREIARVP